MPARPTTAKENLALRAFQKQVERLRQSSIVQQQRVTLTHTTNISFGTGRDTVSFEGYNQEAFQAQLPILRQFILNDYISFNRVHNIINQCCDRQELLDIIRRAKRVWDDQFRQLPDQLLLASYSAVTLEEAIDKVFYGGGGLFHCNIDDPDEDDSIKAIHDGLLHNAFPYLWTCVRDADSVIHWWLDDPNAPVPPCPTA